MQVRNSVSPSLAKKKKVLDNLQEKGAPAHKVIMAQRAYDLELLTTIN